METYSFLRELADSWVLLAMFLFFVGVCIWVFRPWGKAGEIDAAGIPFRNETLTDAKSDTAKTSSEAN